MKEIYLAFEPFTAQENVSGVCTLSIGVGEKLVQPSKGKEERGGNFTKM